MYTSKVKKSIPGFVWLLALLMLSACQGEPAGTPETVASATAPATATATAAAASLTSPATASAETARPAVATATSLPPTTPYPASRYEDYEIITVLPRDAIPAVFTPTFMDATEANEWYDPDELVIGVEFNGEARAYSIPFLSGHEIVNDEVGGVKIAVTW